jgi:hypothetical protein
LNAALASVFAGFYVGPGTMLATDGQRSPKFESLIALEPPQADGTIPADEVACAIYAKRTLDAVSTIARNIDTRKRHPLSPRTCGRSQDH